MTSLRTETAYFRKIRLRSPANIDQHYPKKCLYRSNIIQYLRVAEKEKKQWKSREFFISIKAQNYSIFYLIKVMRSFKQNERTKCKKYDPARTRTWNLLIRSQTPYPLGHEADIAYKEVYCYFTINCITNMHCNIVIFVFTFKWRTWLSRFLFPPLFSAPYKYYHCKRYWIDVSPEATLFG